MICQLETENTGNPDLLYLTIKKKFESLGIISDLAIKEQTNLKSH